MVTTRRKIVTEEDRFGGYAARPVLRVTPVENEVKEENAEKETVRTFSFDERFAPSVSPWEKKEVAPEPRKAVAPPVIEYSTRPYTGIETYSEPKHITVRHEKAAKRESEDIMPSIKTRAYAEDAKEKAARAKMSSRTKVYLGIYLTVAAVLAILVIATGLAVSNINGTADRLQSEIAAQNEILVAQNAEIMRLTDTDRITGAAVNNGMEKVDNATKVDLLPVSEPTRYEGRTNWFDRFCDWLSNLIGG